MQKRGAGSIKCEIQMLRILLLASAAVMIIIGVLNGGMRDVFVKAVNICSECIGLG